MEERNKIVLDNIGLVYEGIRQMNFRYKTQDDWDDVFYYGLLGLIKGASKLDRTKSKSSYLLKTIKGKIYHLYKHNSAIKRDGFVISLEEKIPNYDMAIADILISNTNVEQEVIRKIEFEEVLEIIKRYPLKKNAKITLEYYGIGCNPKTLKELGEEYGVSYQAINYKVKRCIEWVREEIDKKPKKKDKSIEELLKEML